MKYALILYMCSMATQTCPDYTITGMYFNDHYQCALAGYKLSHNTMKELQPEDVNLDRLAIKFECKPYEIKDIVPPPKPKIPA
jgi:hypothetical protein